MHIIYWKKKSKYHFIQNAIPYKGMYFDYAVDGGDITSNITETNNKIISGNTIEIVKRLLPNYYGTINCIYYHLSLAICTKDGIEELPSMIFLLNALLSETGVLLIYTDKNILDQVVQQLNEYHFSTNQIELNNVLHTIFANSTCRILENYKGNIAHIKDLIRLNKLDHGNRQFIIMEPLSFTKNTITKKLMCGCTESQKQDLHFHYYTLGEAMFIGEPQEKLNENLPVKQIREYVWFSETNTNYEINTFHLHEPYLLGIHKDIAYYFYFEAEQITTLDIDSLSIIKSNAKQYIIYANNCVLPKEYLLKNNILFKQIPNQISRI